MARTDPRNRSRLWSDPGLGGTMLLSADFTTHEYAPHVHDEMVVAVTEDGGSEFRSRGLRDSAEPGAVLVFNPGEPHSGRVGRSARWRYRAFYLDAGVLAGLADDLELAAGDTPYFLVNKLGDPGLCRSLLALHHEAEAGGSPLATQAALLTAMAGLFVRHGTPAPRLRRLGDEAAPVAAAIRYLEEHFDQEVALRELAARARMSTFHLIRSFNRALGLPPHAYLTQLRVRRARELLRAGTPAAAVATGVGFYDQSALTRHFKRVYGVTPAQYAAAVAR